MWRAVAVAPVRRGPPRGAGLGIVGRQGADGGDDHNLVDHQRRAGEAPSRRGNVVFGGHVAYPQPPAGLRVQRCQQPRAAQRVQPVARHRRGGAGSGAGVRVPEPHRVGVAPDRLAGRQQIARDHLLVAPLLLGEDLRPSDREGADPRADGPMPQLYRRRRVPVGRDSSAVYDAVTVSATEPRPVRVVGDLRRPRQRRQSFIDRRGQQSCLGGLRPAPSQVVTRVAGHPVGAQQGPETGGQHERGHQRDPPQTVGQPAGGHRPRHEDQAQNRGGVHREHQPHHRTGDRDVEQRHGGERHGHQQQRCAPAL